MMQPAPTSSPPDTSRAQEILRTDASRLEAAMHKLLAREADAPQVLRESIEYSLMAGGKRLRPSLVLQFAGACAGGADWEPSALAAACAMELIHTFSLVHDDLPAMDDDDLRRGRPTNHKVFGEATAILAGDAMVAMAFEALALDAAPRCAGRLVAELAGATGPRGMIGGQVLDMDAENRPLTLAQLQDLHRRKTGALLSCACRMGALAADADSAAMAMAAEYGRALGMAFQIVDDLLDVTASSAQMGKTTGKDAGKGKNTFPGMLGVDASRAAAQEQLGMALLALEPLGQRGENLRQLAVFVVERRK